MYVADSWFIDVTWQIATRLHGGAISSVGLASTIVLSSQFSRCQVSGDDSLNFWGGACFFQDTPVQFSRCCAYECFAFVGQAIGMYDSSTLFSRALNESTFNRCGSLAGKTGTAESVIHFEGTASSFVQLNFTNNWVSGSGSAFTAVLETGTLTAKFLTAVSNMGPAVVHCERTTVSDISDSNFISNTIAGAGGSSFALFYIQYAGIRITRCVISGESPVFYAVTGYTSRFIVSSCVFSNAVPASNAVSSSGNSVRANPTPIPFAVAVPDLCGRFATACPTWSVSPKPTRTLSPIKTQTETLRKTRTNSIAKTQSPLPRTPTGSVAPSKSLTPAQTPTNAVEETESIPASPPRSISETDAERASQSPSSSAQPIAPTAEQTLIAVATPAKSGDRGGRSDSSNNASGGLAGLGVAWLAGIAAAVVALVAIVIVLLVLCRKPEESESGGDLQEGLTAIEATSTIAATELGNHDYQNPLTYATGAPETTEHSSDDPGRPD
jgi:hypothetical protein